MFLTQYPVHSVCLCWFLRVASEPWKGRGYDSVEIFCKFSVYLSTTVYCECTCESPNLRYFIFSVFFIYDMLCRIFLSIPAVFVTYILHRKSLLTVQLHREVPYKHRAMLTKFSLYQCRNILYLLSCLVFTFVLCPCTFKKFGLGFLFFECCLAGEDGGRLGPLGHPLPPPHLLHHGPCPVLPHPVEVWVSFLSWSLL